MSSQFVRVVGGGGGGLKERVSCRVRLSSVSDGVFPLPASVGIAALCNRNRTSHNIRTILCLQHGDPRPSQAAIRHHSNR